ncbi:hypothetical protein CJD36_019180 [Flavipsychrobacter stenotrophus]|uniref:Secretion system C-terminal sorting domain-containing protein n=1 Tax=Flavipsychrobacter stenotrophus TaxID=2077091 RepID=A0A2S7SR39_9BACT|nr:hypothetical protein CJD36_019180 [Flavipsychrobacter stenotrophus]
MLYINQLKRSITLIVVFITTVSVSFAQSYYHSPNDTIIGTAIYEDVSVFNITQVHPTADTISFRWKKYSVAIPATWEASICDNGNCYTTLKDSGTMATIVTGDNGLMSLHVNPHLQSGTGIIRYSIFATNTPSQVDTLTWIITAIAPNAVIEVSTLQPEIIIYNKRIAIKTLNDEYSQVILHDLNGKVLCHKDIQAGQTSISTQEYPTEVLILQLTGKRNFITKIFNY